MYISEIKCDVYGVDGFTVLHSSCNFPQPGNVLQCGRGVACKLGVMQGSHG